MCWTLLRFFVILTTFYDALSNFGVSDPKQTIEFIERLKEKVVSVLTNHCLFYVFPSGKVVVSLETCTSSCDHILLVNMTGN